MTPKPPSSTTHAVAAHAAEAVDKFGDRIGAIVAEVKPRLRGWIHAITSPLALAAGIVLIALSPNAVSRIGSAVFVTTSVLLFTVSAIYHRGTWSPRTWRFLQRFDHANIFLLIAGSYTPFSLLMLDGTARVLMLSIAWGGALLGVALRLLLDDPPRWMFVPIYIALGWVAVFFAGDFVDNSSVAVVALIATGGLLYTMGGVVYGLRRPNPFPSWFGFHEVFHVFTILAFISHYVGVSLATYSLR